MWKPKWKQWCGRRVHLLLVDGEINGLFYDEKQLNHLVERMGYINTQIATARVILNGKKVAKNRLESKYDTSTNII